MEIAKSSRHQKIIGKFGEGMVSNLLSRSGFEVTVVDHTGIDILAYNPSTKQRLGISVKSRTRSKGTERTPVNVFSNRKGRDDRKKMRDACEAFGCEPWTAVYVETSDSADVYLTSLDNYDRKYRGMEAKTIDTWKMGTRYKEQYEEDTEVKHMSINFHSTNWWSR